MQATPVQSRSRHYSYPIDHKFLTERFGAQSFEGSARVFPFLVGHWIGIAYQLRGSFNRHFQALRCPQPIYENLNQVGPERITIQSAVSNQTKAMVDKFSQFEVQRF